MYLLDANVMIAAARLHYAFDLAPGFWEWLDEQQTVGNVASIPRVRMELANGNDQLAGWAADLPGTFWRDESEATLASGALVAEWVYEPGLPYTDAAREEFLGVADFMLVAEGHCSGMTVVTHEKPAPQAQRRVLLPDACLALDVAYADPFDTFRALGLRLVR